MPTADLALCNLGDAGGFGNIDEIGLFEPSSFYAKEKQERTALLAHGDGGYIAAIQSEKQQTEYLERVKAFILSEMKTRTIKVVMASTFMAYSNNCMTGGTLKGLLRLCNELGIYLIMDETLKSEKNYATLK